MKAELVEHLMEIAEQLGPEVEEEVSVYENYQGRAFAQPTTGIVTSRRIFWNLLFYADSEEMAEYWDNHGLRCDSMGLDTIFY